MKNKEKRPPRLVYKTAALPIELRWRIDCGKQEKRCFRLVLFRPPATLFLHLMAGTEVGMVKDSTPRMGRPPKGKRVLNHPHLIKHPDFPLSYHAPTQRFYKSIKGRRYYFGADPVEAERRYSDERHYLERGMPVPTAVGVTVGELVNLWLDDRLKDVKAGSIQQKTWDEYKRVGAFLVEQLGRHTAVASLRPVEEFAELHRAIMKKAEDSPAVGRKWVTYARSPFIWGRKNGKCGPVEMGSRFKPVPLSKLRAKRIERGRQYFTADEINAMLSTASATMRAAMLLGINAGYTQKEVAEIRTDWIDGDIIFHVRHKKGFLRRASLWTETLDAIEAMPRHRPVAAARGLLFTTMNGRPYTPAGDNGLAQSFKRLMDKHGIDLKGSSFGKLRHTHRSIASGAQDAVASRLTMGHQLGDTVSEDTYIRGAAEGMYDDRLKAVADHVRAWLFSSG